MDLKHTEITMGQDLKDILSQKAKIEEERQVIGHDLYDIKDKLPPLVITKESLKDYIHVLKMFKVISNQFGEDITLIYANLCNVYGIQEIEDISDPQKEAIRIFFLMVRGQLAHSLIQCEEIISTIEDKEDFEGEIAGQSYYMIPVALMCLTGAYITLVNCVAQKLYFDQSYIDGLRERLMCLYSPEFEYMRIMFKTVECYQIRNGTNSGFTIH